MENEETITVPAAVFDALLPSFEDLDRRIAGEPLYKIVSWSA